jgi:hypothetical protein
VAELNSYNGPSLSEIMRSCMCLQYVSVALFLWVWIISSSNLFLNPVNYIELYCNFIRN